MAIVDCPDDDRTATMSNAAPAPAAVTGAVPPSSRTRIEPLRSSAAVPPGNPAAAGSGTTRLAILSAKVPGPMGANVPSGMERPTTSGEKLLVKSTSLRPSPLKSAAARDQGDPPPAMDRCVANPPREPRTMAPASPESGRSPTPMMMSSRPSPSMSAATGAAGLGSPGSGRLSVSENPPESFREITDTRELLIVVIATAIAVRPSPATAAAVAP